MNSDVLYRLKVNEGAKQLFCFPYLGGHANVFFEFANKLQFPAEIWAANLPGHGGAGVQPLEKIEAVIDLYVEKLQSIMRPPYFFFGHSMGGIIAYFLARRLLATENCLAKPTALILSACGTPASFKAKNYSSYSDKELMQYLLSYNGISNEILQEKNLLEYLIPIFRADFRVLESTALVEIIEPIDIPVYFLWGENDPIVPITAATEWLNYFSGEINLIPIKNASHMFIRDQVDFFAEKIAEIMEQEN
jgi:external thioesterase TEII